MDATPTPRRGRPPIVLDTVKGCTDELGRLYRDARHGRLDESRATKLAYLLQILIRGHEVATLEARILALESTHEPKP
ncbi:MAG: hypothetical protein KGL51_00460 [Betaproteobacteria bacterium]|nr:hypothetical protein [Betaproteobacteria bacterium]MDE2123589.1 hypothetical protein [Betaproteobacteria bacterium]MDE2186141.1 hypothetical protein [Betaproteobacteria bacterium]MDE2323138.1 hypothetical protein [Betaproteobacteria bacterium]